MTLRRREYDEDVFVEKFTNSVLFSAIDAASYIDWDKIESQVDRFSEQMERLNSIDADTDEEFVEQLEPLLDGEIGEAPLYTLCFRLLGVGDSKDEFVLREGAWNTETGEQIEIAAKDVDDIADVFVEAGIRRVVDRDYDIRSILTGIQIGLESHSRKNRQGDMHEDLLEEELEKIVDALQDRGYNFELDEQYKVDYIESDGTKKVDFALVENGVPKIVFEANCYSAQGSKPSEIKRSYETVARKMDNDGIEYVWVTDGWAWKSSLKKILGEAFHSHSNLYNLASVREELKGDILQFLEEGGREVTQDDLDPQERLGSY